MKKNNTRHSNYNEQNYDVIKKRKVLLKGKIHRTPFVVFCLRYGISRDLSVTLYPIWYCLTFKPIFSHKTISHRILCYIKKPQLINCFCAPKLLIAINNLEAQKHLISL